MEVDELNGRLTTDENRAFMADIAPFFPLTAQATATYPFPAAWTWRRRTNKPGNLVSLTL
jgi:hypothetical protein